MNMEPLRIVNLRDLGEAESGFIPREINSDLGRFSDSELAYKRAKMIREIGQKQGVAMIATWFNLTAQAVRNILDGKFCPVPWIPPKEGSNEHCSNEQCSNDCSNEQCSNDTETSKQANCVLFEHVQVAWYEVENDAEFCAKQSPKPKAKRQKKMQVQHSFEFNAELA